MNREDLIESAIEALMNRGFNERSATNQAHRMSDRMLEEIIYGKGE